MRFAKIVFTGAGIWGIVVLLPLYFLRDITGQPYSPPVDYPHFFYGFISVALAWQLAFLVVGSNPARFRPVMVPSMIEKFGHVAGVVILFMQSRIAAADALAAAPDFLLGLLFVVAFAKTRALRRADG